MLDDYKDLLNQVDWLRKKQVVIIPHGSLVEYLGADNFSKLEIPTFGNREILKWESSREKQRLWLQSSGCITPKIIKDPRDIDSPVIVKYAGAKGGRGYFIARDYRDFRRNVNLDEIGNTATYLVSDMSTAITGEIHYVDCGFNIIGMPK